MSTIDDAVKEIYDDEISPLPDSGLVLEHEMIYEQSDQPVSGERFIAVRVDKVGTTEILKPTLVGLSNMAIQFLPKDFKLVEVIEATREIVSGVRYELIVAARDGNDEDILCRLVVTEITWKVTAWGDKQRDLNYSNCTSNATTDENVPKQNDFNFNPLFVTKTNFINDEDLKRIESQIIKPKQVEKPASKPKKSEMSDFDLSILEAMIIPSKSVKTKELPKIPSQHDEHALDTNTHSISEPKPATELNEKVVPIAAQIDSETQTDSIERETTKQNSYDLEKSTSIDNVLSPAVSEKQTTTATEKMESTIIATESSQKENTLNEPKIEETTLKSEDIYTQTPVVKDTLESSKGIEISNQTERSDIGINAENVETYILPATQVSNSEAESIDEQVTTTEVRKESTEQNENNEKKQEQTLPKIKTVGLQLIDAIVPPSKTVVIFEKLEDNNAGNEPSTEIKYKYEQIEQGQERVRREVNTEMEFLKNLANEALEQLDHVDSDDFKRMVLEIIRVKKVEQENGAIYVIKVRIANSNCSEESDDLQRCLDNVIKDTTKICFIEMKSKRDVNKVIKSECVPDKTGASAPMRFKRQEHGAIVPIDQSEAEKVEEMVKGCMSQLGAPDRIYQLHRITSAKKKIVDGVMYYVDGEFILPHERIRECHMEFLLQEWFMKEPAVTRFNCVGDDEEDDDDYDYKRKKRSLLYDNHRDEAYQETAYEQRVSMMFDEFKAKFNKKYESAMEHATRLRIFKHNLQIIDDLNRMEMGTATYGVTEFADFTLYEYKQRTGLLRRMEENNEIPHPLAKIPNFELPKKFDWREKNAVTGVKNQGSCGSCWAFSVTGNIEGLNAIKTGNLEEFSEQELVDCDSVDKGCNGGLPDNAYKAIEQLGGLETESQYPYEAKKSQCKFDSTLARVKVSGAVDLPKNETAMALYLVQNGPLSIGINANAMQFYRGGISHPPRILCRSGGIDHGVLIVGYGVAEYPIFNKTLPFWIVKNSWGANWGEQGYYRVFRGADTCGVASMVSSAILE
ncbi:putative cysteine proteinase, partial [Pseudolycoriella hygida]